MTQEEAVYWALLGVPPEVPQRPLKGLYHSPIEYRHTWFIDDTAHKCVYIDDHNRLWVCAWGVLKPTTKTRTSQFGVCIDALGGAGWYQRGRYFAVEWRTIDGDM